MRQSIIYFLLVFLFFWTFIGSIDILNYIIFEPNETRILAGLILTSFISIPTLFIKKNIKTYLLIWYFILFLPLIIFLAYLLLFQREIAGEGYYVLYETAPKEIIEFLKSIFDYKIIVPTILISSFPFLIFKKIKPVEIRKKEKALILICCLVFILISIKHFKNNIHYYGNNSAFVGFFVSYKSYKSEVESLKYFNLTRKKTKNQLNTVRNISPKPTQQTYIIIIGESCSKNHMSLYDYPRKTNPLLNNLRNELSVFKNVISPYSYTIPVLKTLLTYSTRKDSKAFYEKESIIEIYNKAGYKTYWISNQAYLGIYDTEVSSIAKESKSTYFTSNSFFDLKNKYDDVLLPNINKALNDSSKQKVIFVHLMGSHENFQSRYPGKFDIYKNGENLNSKVKNLDHQKINIINQYDNSILFNDYVVAEIIKMTKEKNNFSFVLYLSDHAEEVYDERDLFGHTGFEPSKYLYEIPFVLWTSQQYKSALNLDKLTDNNFINRHYCSEDLIHSLLDLSGIRTNDFDCTRSIFSPNFIERDEYKKW